MHDRLDHDSMNEDAALAQALRALPPRVPAPDAWPNLAARIRRRRTVRRGVWFTLPAAFAAGLALTLAWPHVRLGAPAPAPVRVVQTTAPADTHATLSLASLQGSSQQWQVWVQKLDRNGAPLDGRQLAQAVALQDQIGLVDLQLSAARNPTTVASLWQQRITLLQQLGLLHLQPYMVAEQTRAGRAPIISM